MYTHTYKTDTHTQTQVKPARKTSVCSCTSRHRNNLAMSLQTSHVTHMKNKRIMSHIWKSLVTQCHTWTSSTSWHTNDWVMSLQMSHVTYMKDSYYTHERAARHDTPIIESYLCALEITNHVTHTIESCQTQEWAERCDTRMIESCPYKWVTSHVWKSYITHMNEQHVTTHQWLSAPVGINHVTHMNESC